MKILLARAEGLHEQPFSQTLGSVPVWAQRLPPAFPPILERAGLWLAAPLSYSVLP